MVVFFGSIKKKKKKENKRDLLSVCKPRKGHVRRQKLTMYSPKQGPFQSKAHWQLDKM